MSNKNFAHIFYEDWEIGLEYERLIKNKVEYLGKVIDKKLVGRIYDQDMIITFDNKGKIYEHTVSFDKSYRKITQ